VHLKLISSKHALPYFESKQQNAWDNAQPFQFLLCNHWPKRLMKVIGQDYEQHFANNQLCKTPQLQTINSAEKAFNYWKQNGLQLLVKKPGTNYACEISKFNLAGMPGMADNRYPVLAGSARKCKLATALNNMKTESVVTSLYNTHLDSYLRGYDITKRSYGFTNAHGVRLANFIKSINSLFGILLPLCSKESFHSHKFKDNGHYRAALFLCVMHI